MRMRMRMGVRMGVRVTGAVDRRKATYTAIMNQRISNAVWKKCGLHSAARATRAFGTLVVVVVMIVTHLIMTPGGTCMFVFVFVFVFVCVCSRVLYVCGCAKVRSVLVCLVLSSLNVCMNSPSSNFISVFSILYLFCFVDGALVHIHLYTCTPVYNYTPIHLYSGYVTSDDDDDGELPPKWQEQVNVNVNSQQVRLQAPQNGRSDSLFWNNSGVYDAGDGSNDES